MLARTVALGVAEDAVEVAAEAVEAALRVSVLHCS